MTDTQGNIDAATQTARDAAERVRSNADTGASFGASAEEIADDLAATTTTAKSDLSGAVSDIADKVSAAAGKAADAAADAAKAAGAKLKGAADDVDLDEIVAQTRTVAGEWTERLKKAYREQPGVVIAAAAGVVVVAAAIVRSLGRR